jgi:replicative DNA helicase
MTPPFVPVVEPVLNLEQKEALLAHLLRIPALFELAQGRLAVEHFDNAAEGQLLLVWACALELAKKHGPSFLASFETARNLLEIEVKAYLDGHPGDVQPETVHGVYDAGGLLPWIFDDTKPKELAADYGRDLLRRFLNERWVCQPLQDYMRDIHDKTPVNLPEVLKEIQERHATLQQLAGGSTRCLEDDWEAYKERRTKYLGQTVIGLRTGMSRLDQHTLGLRGLILLGAGPNVGKTALAVQIGLNVARAAENDAVCLFVSLDMDRDEIRDRIVCCVAAQDWKTYKMGSKSLRGRTVGPWRTPADEQRLAEADAQLEAGLLRRVQVVGRRDLGEAFTAADVLGRLNALKERAGAARAVVVIDYFQLVPVADATRLDELEADRRRVRIVQDVLAGTRTDENPVGDAVIVISETRKPTGGRRAPWGGQLADFMGSARLTYAADAALIYQPFTDDDEDLPNYDWPVPVAGSGLHHLEDHGVSPIRLSLAKGRDGMRRGRWALAYFFKESRFIEVEADGPGGADVIHPHHAAPYVVPGPDDELPAPLDKYAE